MASVVNVNITGTDELSANITRAEQNVARFGQTVNAQSAQASGAFFRLEGAATKTGVSMRNVGSAVGAVASQIGGLGPVAGLASNAIVAMATAAGPVAIAFGALTAAVGLFVYRIEQAREQMRQLSEIELAGFAREQKGLELEQDIKRRIAVLRSLTPEIEKVRQEFDKTRLELEKGGARPQAVAAADELKALEIRKIRIEQAKKEKEATDQLRKSLVDQADALNHQLIRLELGAEAADQFKINQLLASDAVKKLGAEGVDAVQAIAALMAATRRFNEEQLRMKEGLELTRRELELLTKAEEDAAAIAAGTARDNEILKQRAQDEIQANKTLLELEADRLQLIGQTQQADRLRLQARLEELRQMKAAITDTFDTRVIDAQIANAELALSQFGQTSLDIGGLVIRSIEDIFGALITGTVKAADIGKLALSSLARVANDVFSSILKQVSSGIGQLLFGGGGGASPFSNVLAGAGGMVQLGANTVFSSAGGGGGAGSGGGGASGVLGSIMSGLSSLWSILPTSITTAITTTATAAMTALNSSIMALASNPITWIAAAVVAAVSIIYRVIANQKERPNALFGADVAISFDPMTGEFSPGEVGVSIGRKVGIKNSQAGQIATALQQSIQVLAQQWVDILNIFPDTIKNQIAPAIDDVNAILNQQFNRLKFSPGGSRNIQEELADIAGGVGGQTRFFNAFRGILASGFGASLTQAGIPGVSTAGFANMPGAANRAGFDYLIEQIKSVTTIVAQLARTTGGQFLTGAEVEGLSEIFNTLFSTSDVEVFSNMVAKLEESLKPVLDAIEQALQQSAEIFGRGIMAALEAVSESDAQLAFFGSINQGIKDSVFEGITSSLIATAQFSAMFAPLQKAIRESVQSSIEKGFFDSAAFSGSVLPAIEAILSQVEVLRPMITELQKFGQSINQRLGLGTAEAVAEPINEELTESAVLFGQSLMTAMEAATQSDAMTNFTAAFNTGIKDAVFSGLIESFLATGFVDQILAPIRGAITQAVTQAQGGTFVLPDVTALVKDAGAAIQMWEPLISFLQQIGLGLRGQLGLVPPVETAPVAPGPVNVVINLNGVGSVDQGSIPELARRLNFMLAPQLAPPA